MDGESIKLFIHIVDWLGIVGLAIVIAWYRSRK